MSKREYTHVRLLYPEIKAMIEAGKTQREIAEYYGFKDKYVVKGLLKRERRRNAEGIPKQRGRKPAKTLAEYKYENKRLKMENELLRDFLQSAGRLVQAMLGTYGYRRMCLAKKPKHPQKSQDSTCIMKKYYLLSEIRCRRQ